MKTTLTRLLATVLFAGISAVVQAGAIPLEEVKVGSTVTSEGIGIGWGKYLPVPEGEWEVVVRDDMTYNTGKSNAPVYYIQLLNKDEKSPLQLVQINYANPRGRMSPEVTCNLTEGHIIADRLNTLEGQNYQLCAEIFKPKPYGYKFYFEFRGKGNTIINQHRSERDYIKERFGFSNPKMIISRIETGKKGNLGLRYYFGFKMNTTSIDKNSPEIQNTHVWLINNLNLFEKYYDNQKINFLAFNQYK